MLGRIAALKTTNLIWFKFLALPVSLTKASVRFNIYQINEFPLFWFILEKALSKYLNNFASINILMELKFYTSHYYSNTYGCEGSMLTAQGILRVPNWYQNLIKCTLTRYRNLRGFVAREPHYQSPFSGADNDHRAKASSQNASYHGWKCPVSHCLKDTGECWGWSSVGRMPA